MKKFFDLEKWGKKEKCPHAKIITIIDNEGTTTICRECGKKL